MQKDISTVHGGNNFISPNGLDYTSLYSSFSPYPSSSNSPSSSTTGDLTTATITPISSKTNTRDQEFALSPSPHSILVQEQQDLVNSHNLCLAHLREAAEEAEALRLENTTLRVANRDLNKRLSLVIQTSLQKRLMPSDYILQPPIITGFRDLCIDDKRSNTESGVWPGDHQQGFVQSPTSVMDHQSDLIVKRNGGVERVSLPKSISVRSNGYLKTSQGVGDGNHGSRTRSLNRSRTASPPKATQRVYVRGGRKEGEAVELETFNQGMCKTELCNKWQETGACPYGDHCQFAHGIEELRPVIRHPRYKTEVCRMVLAGDPCPYGHRCHFRHALTDQEKLIAAYNPRVLKLNR